MKSLKKKLLLVILVLLASLASITPLLAEGRCGEFPIDPNDSTNCMSQTWQAWVTAGPNDASNPLSDVWGAMIGFSELNRGQGEVPTSCGFRTYDKRGEQLLYFIKNTVTQMTTLTPGSGGGLSPSQSTQYTLSSPAPLGGSGPIGGPLSITCYSKDPAILRNMIVTTAGFNLSENLGLGGENSVGKKKADVSGVVPYAPASRRWSLPFTEGGDDGKNWENVGFAVTNIATRAQAPNGTTVKISVTDVLGNQGPTREITLAPPLYDNLLPGAYNYWPGETRVVVLWTLFGSNSVEGNELYFPYPNGRLRGPVIYGTLTFESTNGPISVMGTKMIFPNVVLSNVPASPIPVQ